VPVTRSELSVRRIFVTHNSTRSSDRIRQQRLCRAAERVVTSLVEDDAALTGCAVIEVIETRHGTRLIARIGAPASNHEAAFNERIAALARLRGPCRAALAHAVQRKRVPQIDFELYPLEMSMRHAERT
jgi:hypothetical protein